MQYFSDGGLKCLKVLNGVIMFLAMHNGIQTYFRTVAWQLFVYTHMYMASVILVEAYLDEVVGPGHHLRGVADHGELVNAHGFSLIIKSIHGNIGILSNTTLDKLRC